MIKQVLFSGRVEVGVSDINDGNMRFFGEGDEAGIIENQEKLGESIGLSGEKIARVRTIYDGRTCFTDYAEITRDNLKDYSISNAELKIPVTDGLITKCPEVGLFLPLADCLGMAVFDEAKNIAGLLHAGRHNVEQDGPRKFIKQFVEKYGSHPQDLKIYFSPYARNYHIHKLNNMTLDEATRKQLVGEGVPLENIIDS